MVNDIIFYPNAYNDTININTSDKYKYNEKKEHFVFNKEVNNRINLKNNTIILGERSNLW